MPTLTLTPGSAACHASERVLERHARADDIGVRQQEGELVAAEPEGRVAATPVRQRRRDAAQDAVAVVVARGGRCRT